MRMRVVYFAECISSGPPKANAPRPFLALPSSPRRIPQLRNRKPAPLIRVSRSASRILFSSCLQWLSPPPYAAGLGDEHLSTPCATCGRASPPARCLPAARFAALISPPLFYIRLRRPSIGRPRIVPAHRLAGVRPMSATVRPNVRPSSAAALFQLCIRPVSARLPPHVCVQSKPDEESEEARWVTVDELVELDRSPPHLRGSELLQWARYLEARSLCRDLSARSLSALCPMCVRSVSALCPLCVHSVSAALGGAPILRPLRCALHLQQPCVRSLSALCPFSVLPASPFMSTV